MKESRKRIIEVIKPPLSKIKWIKKATIAMLIAITLLGAVVHMH